MYNISVNVKFQKMQNYSYKTYWWVASGEKKELIKKGQRNLLKWGKCSVLGGW